MFKGKLFKKEEKPKVTNDIAQRNSRVSSQAKKRPPNTIQHCLIQAQNLLQQLRTLSPNDIHAFPLLNEGNRLVQQLHGFVASMPPADRQIWVFQLKELQEEIRMLTNRLLSANKPTPRSLSNTSGGAATHVDVASSRGAASMTMPNANSIGQRGQLSLANNRGPLSMASSAANVLHPAQNPNGGSMYLQQPGAGLNQNGRQMIYSSAPSNPEPGGNANLLNPKFPQVVEQEDQGDLFSGLSIAGGPESTTPAARPGIPGGPTTQDATAQARRNSVKPEAIQHVSTSPSGQRLGSAGAPPTGSLTRQPGPHSGRFNAAPTIVYRPASKPASNTGSYRVVGQDLSRAGSTQEQAVGPAAGAIPAVNPSGPGYGSAPYWQQSGASGGAISIGAQGTASGHWEGQGANAEMSNQATEHYVHTLSDANLYGQDGANLNAEASTEHHVGNESGQFHVMENPVYDSVQSGGHPETYDQENAEAPTYVFSEGSTQQLAYNASSTTNAPTDNPAAVASSQGHYNHTADSQIVQISREQQISANLTAVATSGQLSRMAYDPRSAPAQAVYSQPGAYTGAAGHATYQQPIPAGRIGYEQTPDNVSNSAERYHQRETEANMAAVHEVYRQEESLEGERQVPKAATQQGYMSTGASGREYEGSEQPSVGEAQSWTTISEASAQSYAAGSEGGPASVYVPKKKKSARMRFGQGGTGDQDSEGGAETQPGPPTQAPGGMQGYGAGAGQQTGDPRRLGMDQQTSAQQQQYLQQQQQQEQYTQQQQQQYIQQQYQADADEAVRIYNRQLEELRRRRQEREEQLQQQQQQQHQPMPATAYSQQAHSSQEHSQSRNNQQAQYSSSEIQTAPTHTQREAPIQVAADLRVGIQGGSGRYDSGGGVVTGAERVESTTAVQQQTALVPGALVRRLDQQTLEQQKREYMQRFYGQVGALDVGSQSVRDQQQSQQEQHQQQPQVQQQQSQGRTTEMRRQFEQRIAQLRHTPDPTIQPSPAASQAHYNNVRQSVPTSTAAAPVAVTMDLNSEDTFSRPPSVDPASLQPSSYANASVPLPSGYESDMMQQQAFPSSSGATAPGNNQYIRQDQTVQLHLHTTAYQGISGKDRGAPPLESGQYMHGEASVQQNYHPEVMSLHQGVSTAERAPSGLLLQVASSSSATVTSAQEAMSYRMPMTEQSAVTGQSQVGVWGVAQQSQHVSNLAAQVPVQPFAPPSYALAPGSTQVRPQLPTSYQPSTSTSPTTEVALSQQYTHQGPTYQTQPSLNTNSQVYNNSSLIGASSSMPQSIWELSSFLAVLTGTMEACATAATTALASVSEFLAKAQQEKASARALLAPQRRAVASALAGLAGSETTLASRQAAALDTEDFDTAAALEEEIAMLCSRRLDLETELRQLELTSMRLGSERRDLACAQAEAAEMVAAYLAELGRKTAQNAVHIAKESERLAESAAQEHAHVLAQALSAQAIVEHTRAQLEYDRTQVQAKAEERTQPVLEQRKDAAERCYQLAAEVERLRAELAAKEREFEAQVAAVNALDGTLAQIEADREEESRQLAQKEQELSADAAHAAELAAAVDARVAAEEGRARGTEEQVQSLRRQAGALEVAAAEIQHTAEGIRNIVREDAAAAEEETKAEAEEEEARTRLAEVEKYTAEVQNDLASLSQSRSELEAARATAEERLGALNRGLPGLEAAKKSAAAKRDFKEAARVAAEAKSTAAQVDALTAELADTRSQLEQLSQSISARSGELEELRKMVAEERRAAACAKHRLLTIRLRHLQQQLDSALAQERYNEADDASADFSVLKQELEALEAVWGFSRNVGTTGAAPSTGPCSSRDGHEQTACETGAASGTGLWLSTIDQEQYAHGIGDAPSTEPCSSSSGQEQWARETGSRTEVVHAQESSSGSSTRQAPVVDAIEPPDLMRHDDSSEYEVVERPSAQTSLEQCSRSVYGSGSRRSRDYEPQDGPRSFDPEVSIPLPPEEQAPAHPMHPAPHFEVPIETRYTAVTHPEGSQGVEGADMTVTESLREFNVDPGIYDGDDGEVL